MWPFKMFSHFLSLRPHFVFLKNVDICSFEDFCPISFMLFSLITMLHYIGRSAYYSDTVIILAVVQ